MRNYWRGDQEGGGGKRWIINNKNKKTTTTITKKGQRLAMKIRKSMLPEDIS